jgi:hypothetical protein
LCTVEFPDGPIWDNPDIMEMYPYIHVDSCNRVP